MSLIASWVVFPLVLAAVGLGWGALVERGAGVRVNGALVIPLGLAAALVVAGTLTTWAASAPAATPVVAVGALAGLALAWPWSRLSGWALLGALGVLIAYGAPVLLSGQATFLGFIKLDDTGTWFDVIDQVMAHARSVAGIAPSTYTLVYTGDIGPTYPLGAFMLPGVGHALTGIDVAWIFQPYLASCGAAIALSLHALMRPLVASPRLRALLAFVAAQPALLYGYSLWGGIKELTAAFLLVLGAALAAEALPARPRSPRALLPLAVAAGALIQTLGVGAGGWVAPALVLVACAWLARGWRAPARARELRASAVSLVALAIGTAVCIVPVWWVLGGFLSNKQGLFAGLFSSGQTTATKFGNLIGPLNGFQLAGIWPVGDFRLTAPTLPSVLLIGLALIAAAAALIASARRRQFGPALYLVVALVGAGAIYFAGGTPWVTGKGLAISSPAILALALVGGGMLWAAGRRRKTRAGAAASVGAVVVIAALTGGVLWSNALAYHDVALAPRARLAELAHIDALLKGHGPTLLNEYEVYADRHFLREGAPVEPAEYRTVTLALRDGVALTKGGVADLDSFPLSTIEAYPSIITRRSPTESRPPSIYRLIWQGTYYQLWQRAVMPTRTIIEHVPLGESNTLPYCGPASNGPPRSLCSMDPVAVPPCAKVQALARAALAEGATLVAYQRPASVFVRGDEDSWPGPWIHDDESHTLTPTVAGQAIGHIAVARSEDYELWLGGSFARGFEVTVDGRPAGRVKDELSSSRGYVQLGELFLSAGVHTFVFTYPSADLTPGAGLEEEFTSLSAIALVPATPSEMLEVAPAHARSLCGRPLDWIELVK